MPEPPRLCRHSNDRKPRQLSVVERANRVMEISDLCTAARLVRDTGAGTNPELAPLLAAWLDGAAVDAEQIGVDHRAVNFARALLAEYETIS